MLQQDCNSPSRALTALVKTASTLYHVDALLELAVERQGSSKKDTLVNLVA